MIEFLKSLWFKFLLWWMTRRVKKLEKNMDLDIRQLDAEALPERELDEPLSPVDEGDAFLQGFPDDSIENSSKVNREQV